MNVPRFTQEAIIVIKDERGDLPFSHIGPWSIFWTTMGRLRATKCSCWQTMARNSSRRVTAPLPSAQLRLANLDQYFWHKLSTSPLSITEKRFLMKRARLRLAEAISCCMLWFRSNTRPVRTVTSSERSELKLSPNQVFLGN